MRERTLIIALTTVGDQLRAESMARTLVSERLAACVSRCAVASTYRWNETIENDEETLLVIKSTSDVIEELRERVRELHPYEVPEFIVIEASQVGASYLAWALSSCARNG